MPMVKSKAEAAKCRHAAHYLDILRRENLSLTGPARSLNVDTDWANLKQGQAWVAEMSSANEAAAKLCVEYVTYGANWLLTRYLLEEAVRWIACGRAAAKTLNSPLDFSIHSLKLGELYALGDDHERSLETYERCLAHVRTHFSKDVEGKLIEGLVLIKVGEACQSLHLFKRATSCYEQAMHIAHETQNKDIELIALISQGRTFAGYGDRVKSKACYQAALFMLRDAGQPSQYLQDGLTIGNLHLELGNYQEAVECFETTLTSGCDKSFTEVGSLYGLASAYWGAGNSRRAIDTYTRLLSLCRELNMAAAQADVLSRLASVHLGDGDLPNALARCRGALNLFEELGSNHFQAEMLVMMGGILGHLGRSEQVAECYQRALRLAGHDPSLVAEIKLSLAMSTANTGDRKQVVTLIEEELEQAARDNDPLRRAKALLAVASLEVNGGDTRRALASAEESLKQARANDHPQLELSALKVLMTLYGKQNDFANAARAARHALSLLQHLPYMMIERQQFLRGLWASYLQLKDYPKALECARQRLETARLAGNRKEEGEALIETGAVNLCQGHQTQAAPLISQGFIEITQHGSLSDIATAHHIVGMAYETNGDIEKAISSYEEAARVGRDAGHYNSIKEALEALNVIFGKLDDTERKMRFCKSYLDFALENDDSYLAAKAHYSMGVCCYSLRQYEQSVLHQQEGLKFARELGARDWEHSCLMALAQSLEAVAQAKAATGQDGQAQIAAAAEQYSKQLELARELDNPDGKLLALEGLGRMYSAMGSLSHGAALLEECLSLALVVNHSKVATILLFLTEVYLRMEQPQKAIAVYEARLSECRAGGDIKSESTCLLGLATIYARIEQPQHAIQLTERAAEIAANLCDPGNEGMAMYTKAQVLAYKLGRHEEAISLALAAVEKVREAGAQSFVLDSFKNEIAQWRQPRP